MKHIDVNYDDLRIISERILKDGTVVEDGKMYVTGFAKDIDIPVILKLSATSHSCILINVDFDIINDKIISFYMKDGFYVKITPPEQDLYRDHWMSITLYKVD